MSLRPEICGFKLDILRGHFGSKNATTISKAIEALKDKIEFDDPKYLDIVIGIINRSVMTEGPPKGSSIEDDNHVFAINALAGVGQTCEWTDSNIWKIGAFEELDNRIGKTLGREARSLLSYILNGRPIIGKRIQSDSSHYAYLTLEEVHSLRGVLKTVAEKREDPTGDGFLGALIGWLDQISNKGLDLWLFVI